MTYDQLIQLLIKRQAFIVHCSRPGKADIGNDGLLFPEDLRKAITICTEKHHELSCSLIWPSHVKTFGDVGIILKPRTIDSIKSISPCDSGTSPDENGKRQGLGVSISAEAVMDTFENSHDYNEWTVTDADVIGIFVKIDQPLEIAKEVLFSEVPGYELSMGDGNPVIGPVRITIEDVRCEFPDLPLYGYAGTKIVKIIDAASLYS